MWNNFFEAYWNKRCRFRSNSFRCLCWTRLAIVFTCIAYGVYLERSSSRKTNVWREKEIGIACKCLFLFKTADDESPFTQFSVPQATRFIFVQLKNSSSIFEQRSTVGNWIGNESNLNIFRFNGIPRILVWFISKKLCFVFFFY